MVFMAKSSFCWALALAERGACMWHAWVAILRHQQKREARFPSCAHVSPIMVHSKKLLSKREVNMNFLGHSDEVCLH